ncbi:MAG: GC-type dockerin domain-anchored protein, partial [Phycisphaerales bacterium JB041]
CALPISALALTVPTASSGPCTDVEDAVGDAVVRRTDPGNDGALHGLSVLPDIARISVCGWEAFNPSTDPFTGQTVDGEGAHLFRLSVEFEGLVNPAGRVLGANPDPFAFGPSPLIGFIDVDVDHRNSGGELGTAAESRYLANVARFGVMPESSIADRVARGRDDLDNNFYTTPQYERTGADFALVLCGCDAPTVVAEGGDGDGTFEAGETWVVRSRLFERAQGYAEASAATGGSAPGLYDPPIDVQFSHDVPSDRTTVTVVWAIDMIGAAALAGGSVQPIDYRVDNHTSVIEALSDIIEGATIGGFSGPGWTLVSRWEGREVEDYLDPSDWEVTGLVGLPYLSTAEGLYAWTDTAGDEQTFGDCDADGLIDGADEAAIRGEVYDNDGTATDGDGTLNGVWTLINPGYNFSLYDLNGDMVVDRHDIGGLRPLGDFDFNGTVNTQDFIAFLNAWVARQPTADFDLNQVVNTQDFIAFLNAWVGG